MVLEEEEMEEPKSMALSKKRKGKKKSAASKNVSPITDDTQGSAALPTFEALQKKEKKRQREENTDDTATLSQIFHKKEKHSKSLRRAELEEATLAEKQAAETIASLSNVSRETLMAEKVLQPEPNSAEVNASVEGEITKAGKVNKPEPKKKKKKLVTIARKELQATLLRIKQEERRMSSSDQPAATTEEKVQADSTEQEVFSTNPEGEQQASAEPNSALAEGEQSDTPKQVEAESQPAGSEVNVADDVEMVELLDEGKEEEEEDVEIIAEYRNEERNLTYNNLFSYLPKMSFHQAIILNSWNHMFWIFKAYPAVSILAQGFPRSGIFAQRLIKNESSTSGTHMRITVIPKSYYVASVDPSPASSSAGKGKANIVEHSDSTTDSQSEPSYFPRFYLTIDLPPLPSDQTPIQPSSKNPIQSTPPPTQPTKPSLPPITQTDIPSTSGHEYFQIPPHMTEDSYTALTNRLTKIQDDISQLPTVFGIADLTSHMEEQICDNLTEQSKDVHKRLDDVIHTANNLPEDLARAVYRKLNDIVHTVSEAQKTRDALWFNKLEAHQKAVEMLQSTSLETATGLIKQIFEMKELLTAHTERADTSLTLVHQKQEQTDRQLQEHRDDISASQTQMKELITSVQQLADEVHKLNDDTKGENTREGGRGRSNNDRGRGNNDRGRGGRGRGTTSTPSRRVPSRISQTSIYPPRFETVQHQGQASSSSARPSSSRYSANVESDLQRWDQELNEELRIKEELALLREAEQLKKDEEERRELLRRSERRDPSSSSRRDRR